MKAKIYQQLSGNVGRILMLLFDLLSLSVKQQHGALHVTCHCHCRERMERVKEQRSGQSRGFLRGATRQ
jgi:hypothetical protein